MIKEAYVSFEVARLLKEKGFNEECNRVYEGPNLKYTTLSISPLMSLGELGGFHPKQLYVSNNELGDIVYTAPTQQMAMAWLRKKNISIEPSALNAHSWAYTIYKLLNNKVKELYNDGGFDSYEDAAEAALKYYLENLFDYGNTREDLCSC